VKIEIYKTTNLSVVLYRFETWPLILREEHRVKVFQNRMQMQIFGPKKDEILRGWRTLLAPCSHSPFLLCLFLDHEDGGDMFLRNVD
jgi:hypothetical protein